MESPTAFPRFSHENPKKRTFTGGGSGSGSGSSSAACEEMEVLESPPPEMDRSSKPKLSKEKEVPEIIDLDAEEACDDASLMDSEAEGSAKGKEVLSNSSVGGSGSADEESGDDIAILSDDDAAELEDSNEDDSDLYFGEDEWVDTDYDNMVYDDDDHLEAHFDNMELPPGVEAPVPWFRDTPKNDAKGPSTSTHAGTSLRTGPKKVVDEIVHKFETFPKFETVEDYSDHYYFKKFGKFGGASKAWSKRIQDEWKVLEKNLPAEIYVRAYESRMDLMRAVIIGAEGTPYHDGLFFFDIHFPSNYPQIPPNVHYHSGGLRINPNLYNCGKVCLSLLNTWPGKSTKEQWIPDESTVLQVLVSIQGLILNAEPYFNEPGYASSIRTKQGQECSSKYSETTFMDSLKTMMYSMKNPPKNFENFVIGYFRKHARYILVSCVAYLNGARVGCLLRGGIRDFSKGDQRCSDGFKGKLRSFTDTLIDKFIEIGADGCQDFKASTKKDGSKTESNSNC